MSEEEATPEVEPTEEASESEAPVDTTEAAEGAVADILKKSAADDDDEPVAEDEPSDDDVEDEDDEDESIDLDEAVSEETDESGDTSPEFSDELLTRAVKRGMSLSDARDFGTPESLEKALNLLDSNDPQSDSRGEEQEEEFNLPKLDPEEYDEDVIKLMEARDEVITKQRDELKEIRQLLEQQGEQMRASQEERFYDQVDDAFSSMAGWKDVIGTGDRFSLGEDSAELKNRVQILEEFNVLQEADAKAGRSTAFKKQMEKAAKNVFSDHANKVERARIKANAKRRDKSKINRPRSDRDTRMSPEDAAVAAVRRRLESVGSDE